MRPRRIAKIRLMRHHKANNISRQSRTLKNITTRQSNRRPAHFIKVITPNINSRNISRFAVSNRRNSVLPYNSTRRLLSRQLLRVPRMRMRIIFKVVTKRRKIVLKSVRPNSSRRANIYRRHRPHPSLINSRSQVLVRLLTCSNSINRFNNSRTNLNRPTRLHYSLQVNMNIKRRPHRSQVLKHQTELASPNRARLLNPYKRIKIDDKVNRSRNRLITSRLRSPTLLAARTDSRITLLSLRQFNRRSSFYAITRDPCSYVTITSVSV